MIVVKEFAAPAPCTSMGKRMRPEEGLLPVSYHMRMLQGWDTIKND